MEKDAVDDFKVVVIGGSAGSLEVILNIIHELPVDTGAVFIIVVHRRNDKDSILEHLFSVKTRLTVNEVEDKQPITLNTIFIAPPDYHLLVENEAGFSLDSSERVNYSRPSIDVTFQSVAEVFGKRAVGVLLSGANADGAEGIESIRNAGGYTIVQNPATAEVSFMPLQAINLGGIDAILDAEHIAGHIRERCAQRPN
ncbi:MAG: chemotaxis protein CheB [Bacteroidota bacterium]|nr:chemotaxis protein CheB [Ferruginibacter sp.]